MWGTCLGFEELTYLTLGKSVLVKNDMGDAALPLNFTDGQTYRRDGGRKAERSAECIYCVIFFC